MPAAMTLINSQTLSSAVASISFSSFSGYRDLRLVANFKTVTTPGATDSYIQFNSDSGANYSQVKMYGTTGAFSGTGITTGFDINIDFNTRFGLMTMDILDYSQTDKHKTILKRENDAGYWVGANAGRWASTAAVTSILFMSGDGGSSQFAVGSTFMLYGIAG